jgi:hypothetical protein
MSDLRLVTFERYFILIFGIAHFGIPLLLPPNFGDQTTIFGFLRIADFVIPGCLAVASLAIVYFFRKKLAFGFLIAFLYSGGIVFHLLFLSGLFPSVIVVPSFVVSIGGILLDVLSIFAIFDYYRRVG